MRTAAVFSAILCSLALDVAKACSTFCLRQDASVVFGRNYDFDTGIGVVLVNQRGVLKTSLPKSNSTSISWVSAYGSVTFNQFGKEYPMDGMNERGLVIALMWLDGSVYPAADDRPALGVLEWIQYQLDRYASVVEVIAHAEETRVSGGTPLHYLIADAGGDAATIEYLGGALVVHHGATLPAPNLTNDSYERSLQYLRGFSGFGGTRGMPGGTGSLDRFVRTAMLLALPSDGQQPVDRALNILTSVAQPGSTRWSAAYDATHREVTWTTDVTPARKTMRFDSLDFACAPSLMSIDVRSPLAGDVGDHLQPLGAEENLQRMIDAYNSTALIGDVSRTFIDRSAEHAQSFVCLPKRRRAVR
jgi:penicillin V acylase-like amidase (Ntn superfamily)